jgi:predicted peptidase
MITKMANRATLMNKNLLILVIFIFVGGCKHENLYGDVLDLKPLNLTRVELAITQNIGGYYIGLPDYYGKQVPKKKFPVIVCFHGGGAFGENMLDEVLPYGIPRMVREKTFPPNFSVNGNNYSFIVAAPQFISMPTNNDIKSFLDYINTEYRIDASRIYFVGTSIGGKMACDYAGSFPREIAAVVAMSGVSNDGIDSIAQNFSNSELPLWVFHNRTDQAWPVASATDFVNTINSFSPRIKPMLTIFEKPEGEKDHDSWTRACQSTFRESGRNIYEWMLQYNR